MVSRKSMYLKSKENTTEEETSNKRLKSKQRVLNRNKTRWD